MKEQLKHNERTKRNQYCLPKHQYRPPQKENRNVIPEFVEFNWITGKKHG